MDQATREILWNVSHPIHSILMYALLLLAIAVGAIGVFRKGEIILGGKSSPQSPKSFLKRLRSFYREAVFQRSTNRDSQAILFHSLIYLGFLVLLFTTTMVFIDHDLGWKIYRGKFYLAITILSDLFGLGLAAGVLVAAHRRYIQRPSKLHNEWGDALLLFTLLALVFQGYALEGLRIFVTSDPWKWYSPIGALTSQLFWPLSDSSALTMHRSIWWMHTLTVYAVVALSPYTKYFHLIASAANLYFRPERGPKGQLLPIGDLETLLEKDDALSLGYESINNYSWKHLLDLAACTSCGRCQTVCPAYISGKPLSPKWLILNTRNHSLALEAEGLTQTESLLPKQITKLDNWLGRNIGLSSIGVQKISQQNSDQAFYQGGMIKETSEPVRSSLLQLGGDTNARIAGMVMDPNVFWSCTTCMACVEACPVGINQVDHIIENRRNMVMMHGDIPSEAQATLRALETRGNPFGAPQDRIKWADGLNVPIVTRGDKVDVLYWVGCISAYDKRKQKIARAMVEILNSSGISYGILGEAECCTGDPARRLGEENLFQTLAKQNTETLRGIRCQTIVANCPHCFNSIKNEYGEFGGISQDNDKQIPRVIHHTQLIKELIDTGKIKISLDSNQDEITFHDPCYLGRYNDEYEAPRETLVKIGSQIKEMSRNKEKGLCCGAGGGHFWMDLKLGERVNSIRVNEAASTNTNKIATGCPFCLQMMEDGVKATDREESLKVFDIAELVAARLATRASQSEKTC
jgi:Fe-S oxidoreductase/nitrate reductase gamma subunit